MKHHQINLNSIMYSIFIIILFMMMGLEQSTAAETAGKVVDDGFSIGTWFIISLGLAAVGFKTRSKS